MSIPAASQDPYPILLQGYQGDARFDDERATAYPRLIGEHYKRGLPGTSLAVKKEELQTLMTYGVSQLPTPSHKRSDAPVDPALLPRAGIGTGVARIGAGREVRRALEPRIQAITETLVPKTVCMYVMPRIARGGLKIQRDPGKKGQFRRGPPRACQPRLQSVRQSVSSRSSRRVTSAHRLVGRLRSGLSAPLGQHK